MIEHLIGWLSLIPALPPPLGPSESGRRMRPQSGKIYNIDMAVEATGGEMHKTYIQIPAHIYIYTIGIRPNFDGIGTGNNVQKKQLVQQQ